MTSHSFWSAARVEALILLCDGTRSSREIAEELSKLPGDPVSRRAVLGKTNRLGIVALKAFPSFTPPPAYSRVTAPKPRVKATRTCLCCQAPFASWGPGNRLCSACRPHGGGQDYSAHVPGWRF